MIKDGQDDGGHGMLNELETGAAAAAAAAATVAAAAAVAAAAVAAADGVAPGGHRGAPVACLLHQEYK